MEVRSVETIVQKWNEAGVRYMIAGGLAVVAHGYHRFTADFDAILDMDVNNLNRALQVLEGEGYVPRAPVPIVSYADAAQRELWAREKGMMVFSLWSNRHAMTEVDLFLEPPFAFDEAYTRAHFFELTDGIKAAFVPYDELIEMKRRAARPRDLEDVEKLHTAREAAGGGAG